MAVVVSTREVWVVDCVAGVDVVVLVTVCNIHIYIYMSESK